MNAERRALLGLLLVSVIWGTTFVAVKSAVAQVSPLLFVALRFALASAAAVPLVWKARRAREGDAGGPVATRPAGRSAALLGAGCVLGLALAVSYATQTIGLTSTDPARSAFITALNVVLIPLWAALLLRQAPGWRPILGLVLTLPGLYLLTSPQAGAWRVGDSWTLVCAVVYALYAVLLALLGRDQRRREELLLLQLLATAILAGAASLVLEKPHVRWTPGVLGALLLTALPATTGAIWLQLRFQPRVRAARAALVYATEPVFAAFFAWMWSGATLAGSAWAGAALILGGILLAEWRGAPAQQG